MVVGIDVGGTKKGFHVVTLASGVLEARHFATVPELAIWCKQRAIQAIAIDAPCGWALTGGSRLAERTLRLGERRLSCFLTPTRERAQGNPFYDWVFHGETLYEALAPEFSLFEGERGTRPVVFETFPHAITCTLRGEIIPAHPKSGPRRQVLRAAGLDDQGLTSLDFVDAALCALTAEKHCLGETQWVGQKQEGFLVLPKFAHGGILCLCNAR